MTYIHNAYKRNPRPWNENHEANKQAELEEVQSLSHREVDEWNSLPSKVSEARDVEQFKAEPEEAWEDIRLLHTTL